MSEKSLTIRIPEDLKNDLQVKGASINKSLVDDLRELRIIKKVALMELRGVFCPEEWKFIFETMKGASLSEELKYNKDYFLMCCEDAETYHGTAKKCGVDIEKFRNKVERISAVVVWAIYKRMEMYYMKNDSADLDAWFCY